MFDRRRPMLKEESGGGEAGFGWGQDLPVGLEVREQGG